MKRVVIKLYWKFLAPVSDRSVKSTKNYNIYMCFDKIYVFFAQ